MAVALIDDAMISDAELVSWMSKGDDWELMNSRRSDAAFRLLRQRMNQELRQQRNRQSLEQRIYALIRGLHHINSAVAASSVGRSSASAEGHLPFIDEGIGHLSPEDTKRYLGNLGSSTDSERWDAVIALEHAIDLDNGYLRFDANQTGDERDKRILQEFAGYTPQEVVTLQPSLGDVQTIRSVRKNAGLDPKTGHSLDGESL